jgi:hypothetical protein
MSAKPAQVHFSKGCKACVRIAVDLNWDTETVGIWSNCKVLPSKIYTTREKKEIVPVKSLVVIALTQCGNAPHSCATPTTYWRLLVYK